MTQEFVGTLQIMKGDDDEAHDSVIYRVIANEESDDVRIEFDRSGKVYMLRFTADVLLAALARAMMHKAE